MSADNQAAREAAANAVVEAWHAERPGTDDPDFWLKHAAHDERLADAYRALNRVTHDQALSMALQDAEEARREKAKDERKNAATLAALAAVRAGVSS